MSAGCEWTIPNTPERGWDEITFKMRVVEAASESGWFFAYQWDFVGGNTAYIGIQPRPNGMAETRFSVFGTGTRPVDTTQCAPGADGGNGVTCDKFTFELHRNLWYFLRIKRDRGTNIWRGTLWPLNGTKHEIGAWEISHSGGFPGYGFGFLERYRWCPCDQLPRVVVDYGRPLHEPTWTAGRTFNPHHDAGCSGPDVNFVGTTHAEHIRIGYGWCSGTCGDKIRPVIDDPQQPCGSGDVNVNINVNINGER